MAKDALVGFLFGMEEDGEKIPAPSAVGKETLPEESFVALIEVWTDVVRDEMENMENKAVKKILTIRKWLNDAAEQRGISFSQLLQYALTQQLGIKHHIIDKRS